MQTKHRHGSLFIMSGPSGVGKTAVARELLGKIPTLRQAITCTSRKPRQGEKHKHDYYFISPSQFRKLLDKNYFLEWAEVHNHLYGTPKNEVDHFLKSGLDVLLIIDVQGAFQVKRLNPRAHLIFLKPDNMKSLARHIKKRRQNMSLEDLIIRLANAKREMSQAKEYDHIVINYENHLDKTVAHVARIIRTK